MPDVLRQTPAIGGVRPAAGARLATHHLAFGYFFLLGISPLVKFVLAGADAAFGTLVAGLLFVLFGYAVALFLLNLRGSREPRRLPGAAKLLVALVAWAAFSLLWTAAASTWSAIGYVALAAIELVIIHALIRVGDPGAMMRWSVYGLIASAIFLFLVPLLMGERTEMMRLGSNALLHPNTLGRQMVPAALATLYLTAAPWTRGATRAWLMAVLAVLITGILLTLSKTSIIAFVVSSAVFVIYSNIGRLHKIGLIVTLALCVGALWGNLIKHFHYYLSLSEEGGGLSTLSGRTIMWNETWSMISQAPLFGHGVMAYRDIGPEFGSLRMVHAHNEFLQTWFAYGLVGVAILVAAYAALIKAGMDVARLPDSRADGVFALALIVAALVFGLTEAGTVTTVLPLTLLFLIAVHLSARRRAGIG